MKVLSALLVTFLAPLAVFASDSPKRVREVTKKLLLVPPNDNLDCIPDETISALYECVKPGGQDLSQMMTWPEKLGFECPQWAGIVENFENYRASLAQEVINDEKRQQQTDMNFDKYRSYHPLKLFAIRRASMSGDTDREKILQAVEDEKLMPMLHELYEDWMEKQVEAEAEAKAKAEAAKKAAASRKIGNFMMKHRKTSPKKPQGGFFKSLSDLSVANKTVIAVVIVAVIAAVVVLVLRNRSAKLRVSSNQQENQI